MTLPVRWLSHIFNRTTCIYQTDTRWDFPPYQIIIWLVEAVTLVFVSLLDDLIPGFCYNKIYAGGLALALTITRAFQVNRQTKCASHLEVCLRVVVSSIAFYKWVYFRNLFIEIPQKCFSGKILISVIIIIIVVIVHLSTIIKKRFHMI